MIKADVEAVDKERNVALVLVVAVWKCGEGIGGSCEEGRNCLGDTFFQFSILFRGELSLTK